MVYDFDVLLPEANRLGELLSDRGWTVTTAESCTGGLLAALFTEVSGSSGWFNQGVVSYANAAKQQLLDVPSDMLESEGAVSAAVVMAMAAGAVRAASADIAVAISGIAGPDGGTPLKPVGTVWIGWQLAGQKPDAQHNLFSGDRRSVRQAAMAMALRGTIGRLSDRVI